MPLLQPTMKDAILAMTDAMGDGFVGWPTTVADAAENWAEAARLYFVEMVVPPTTPVHHDTAKAAMLATLLGFPQLDQVALTSGFQAYATTLAGVAPPVTTPPPAPFVFPALPPTSDPVVPAVALSSAVDTWARTGTYSTGGPPVPWS